MIKDHIIKDQTCPSCKKQGEYESVGRLYCKSHFEESIQKRIRKYIRSEKLFKKNQNVLVIGRLTAVVLKDILKDLPLNVTIEETYEKENKENYKNYDIIVLPWTLDEETGDFTNKLFYSKLKTQEQKEQDKIIKLFINISDKEILSLSKIKQIPINLERQKTRAEQMVDFIEKKFPDTKFSYYNSIVELKTKK